MLKEMFEEKLKKVKPHKMSTLESSVEKEHYPTVYLTSDTLPEIKDWEVGEEYKIVMIVEQKSKSMNVEGKEEKYNADFAIKKIGCMDMEGSEDEEDSKEKLKEKYL